MRSKKCFTQQHPNIYYRDEVVIEGEKLFSSPSLFPCDTISLRTNFYYWWIQTLFPFPSLFCLYKNCAHLHNSWVSIIKLTHARTQKYNLHGTRNERRTCRTISFCIYMVQVDIYMCALSIALFCKLLNKNNTITIS